MERSDSNQTTSRRGFFGWVAGISVIAWLGSIIYPVVAYLKPPAVAEPDVASVEVVKLSAFPAGSSKIFKFGRRPGLLIHTKSGELKAFFATCTHLDCTVQYREDWNLIWCACHNGRYDMSGRNVSGPPPRPLDPLHVEVKGDDIFVHQA